MKTSYTSEKIAFIPKTKMEHAAYHAVHVLQNAGFKAFFVGGAVRDILLGKQPHDIDIATSAPPGQISSLFEKSIPIGASFGIITVILDDMQLEIATLRAERGYSDGRHPDNVDFTDNEELDVTRRDFTINGLLLDPVRCVLHDYVGGVADLKQGILRTIGNAAIRFSEDHLRILRAARFASALNFSVEPDTSMAAKKFAYTLTEISMERIKSELERILLGPNPEFGFRLLAEWDALKFTIPELDATRGVKQYHVYHPEGDVFEHTMLLLRHAKYHTGPLMWSALLHDVGKPRALSWDGDVPHFYSHESIGADMAREIMIRLKASSELVDTVEHAVRYHMRFAHVDQMKKSKWMRIVMEKNFPMELELHRLDCVSSHGLMKEYLFLIDQLVLLNKEKHDMFIPFLTGKDLIKAGFVPGPIFKTILEQAQDMQLEGKLKTRKHALSWLNDLYCQSRETFE